MIFLNISFAIVYLIIAMFMSRKLEHSNYTNEGGGICGPFKNDENWQDPIQDISEKNIIFEKVYTYAKYYPLQWLILIIVLLAYFLKGNTIKVLKEFSLEQAKEYKLTISDLERSIARMKHKIELKELVKQQ